MKRSSSYHDHEQSEKINLNFYFQTSKIFTSKLKIFDAPKRNV